MARVAFMTLQIKICSSKAWLRNSKDKTRLVEEDLHILWLAIARARPDSILTGSFTFDESGSGRIICTLAFLEAFQSFLSIQ